ncbi:NAD(P)H-dependent glycerol-3-phosphate dehydrogenase [Streptomyces sp. NPDC001927]
MGEAFALCREGVLLGGRVYRHLLEGIVAQPEPDVHFPCGGEGEFGTPPPAAGAFEFVVGGAVLGKVGGVSSAEAFGGDVPSVGHQAGGAWLPEAACLGGETLGADLHTAGLGAGDLIATCCLPLCRNRSFGEHLGRGLMVAEAMAATG